MNLADRIHALIFNGITKAATAPGADDAWMRLSERNRFAEAVYAELRAGNIEFRLGPLALLADATVAEHEARVGTEEGGEPTICGATGKYGDLDDLKPYVCRLPPHGVLGHRWELVTPESRP